MLRNDTQKKRYSRGQWKVKYEELQQNLKQTTDQNKVKQLNDALITLEQTDKHYDYFYEPRKLLESLIADVERVFADYDSAHLINQGNETRFCMLEISTLMHKMQNANRRLKEQTLIEEACRFRYDELCTALEKNAAEIRYHDKILYQRLMSVFQQYGLTIAIVIPLTDFSINEKDLAVLQQAEKAAYQEALKELRLTLTRLPATMAATKTQTNDLINYIEAKRNAATESACFFKKSPFDYKRHTTNLKKTNELLNSPLDYAVQKSYQSLIKSNTDENKTNDIVHCMGLLLLGIVAFAVGLALVVLSQGAIIPVVAGSASMTGGVGLSTFSLLKKRLMPTTATHVSNVLEATKHDTDGDSNHSKKRCL